MNKMKCWVLIIKNCKFHARVLSCVSLRIWHFMHFHTRTHTHAHTHCCNPFSYPWLTCFYCHLSNTSSLGRTQAGLFSFSLCWLGWQEISVKAVGGGLPEKWGPYGDCMVECLGLGQPPLPPHTPEQPTLLLALRSALSDGVQALGAWGASRAALPISFHTAAAYSGTADLLRTESKWDKTSVGKSPHIIHFIFRY